MSAHRASEQGSFVGLTSAKGLKPSALKLAARTGLNLDQIKRVADLAAAGRTSSAVRVADAVQRDIERNQMGQVVCGPQPPRDWRRPIVAEYHELAATLAAAGTDVVATIQGVANFLPTATPNQRRFLQASEAPAAGAIMRPAILGRTLMGISAKVQLCIQPRAGAGAIGTPDAFTSNAVTDLFYTYQCQIFPSSSAEPLMDATPLEYFRGGRMLPENVESPVVNDAFNIFVLEPGNANAVGSLALQNITLDFDYLVSGYVCVAGLFVNGV
jgi:hypothetical protein